MTRNEIVLFLDCKYGTNDLSNISRWLKIKYPEVYESIFEETKYLNPKCIFSERLYHILYDLYSPVLCTECDKKVNFKTLYFGYYTFCSTKCSMRSEATQNNKKETCIKKYGVDSFSKTTSHREKTQETNLKNFGVLYPAQSDEIKKKTKEIFLEKYGVDSPMKVSEIKDKVQISFIESCKENSNFKNEINTKKKKTFQKNFGFDHFMKSDCEIKQRIVEKQNIKVIQRLDKILETLNLELVDKEYNNAFYKHNWKCKKCGNFFIQIWNVIQQGFTCPTCFPRPNGFSLTEKEVVNFIKEILPTEEVIENSKNIINPKELDIYIPSKNIAIEFNGLYWHTEDILLDTNYHVNKTNACKEKGIRLIHIFEDEWLIKKEIVKSRLIQILKVNNSIKIYARKCTIKEIDAAVKNQFLDTYHIQGRDSSVIKLGAFYNDKLISVMTFSKGNISKGSVSKDNIWELNRFCNNYNYHIPGVAGKLLSYFKKNYKWEQIYSYADRRWSEGNLYYKLGFDFEKDTGINYWYLKDFQRIHRFNLRKRPDEPKDIPEWALRKAEGYSRIWDCGNLKFKMINKEI